MFPLDLNRKMQSLCRWKDNTTPNATRAKSVILCYFRLNKCGNFAKFGFSVGPHRINFNKL